MNITIINEYLNRFINLSFHALIKEYMSIETEILNEYKA